MKRPLCLIGTTLATLAGLATPTVDEVAPPPGPPDDNHEYEYEYTTNFIIPVPRTTHGIDVDSSSSYDSSSHWPHPSHRTNTLDDLDNNNNSGNDATDTNNNQPGGTTQTSSRRKRRRQLHHSTKGAFHNLVLLLRFADHTSRKLPSQADIGRLYNSQEFSWKDNNNNNSNGKSKSKNNNNDDYDVAPTGSIRQVYLSNSYNTFTIETTVVNWITLSKPESYYGNGNHGFSKFKEAIVEGLMKLDADASLNPNNGGDGGGNAGLREKFDFHSYDLDENGALDGLGILHSGYGAEFGGDDCYGTINEDRIWSHKGGIDWTSSSSSGSIGTGTGDGNGVKVNRYYVSSALRGKCHANIVRMGVICHELGHYLGLPDLYDGTFAGTGLGAYDYMSQSWGLDGSGLYPPNLSAWSKVKAHWANLQQISHDGTYELQESSSSNIVYKIQPGDYPEGEYLLLENRQPVEYDGKITQGGIAIYHIDENANGQRYRGFPSHLLDETDTNNGWPNNGEHYQVALLATDGEYDLERGVNHGDAGDLWHAGSKRKELTPGLGVPSNPTNYPNTDSYQNGHVKNVGLRIYGFSPSGLRMSFKVEGLGPPPAGVVSLDNMGLGGEDSNSDVTTSAISLESMLASSKLTPEPSTSPKSKPTTSQPTLNPVTKAPTVQPTSRPSYKPVSSVPSRQPSSSPIATTAMPTSDMLSFSKILLTAAPTSLCANLCLTPIPKEECPTDPYDISNCLDSNVSMGDICDGDGECGTNQFLNNCRAYDVYRRVECSRPDVTVNSGYDPAVGSMPHEHHSAMDGEFEHEQQEQSDALEGMTNWIDTKPISDSEEEQIIVLTQPIEEEGSSLVTLTGSPTSKPTTSAPSPSPSSTPTSLPHSRPPSKSPSSQPSANPTTDSSIQEAQSKPAPSTEDSTSGSISGAVCPFYPGWNIGLSYCLQDCHQPTYMKSNPIFEFATVDECCNLHYGGRISCKTETLMTIKKRMADARAGLGLGTITGQIWKDQNGNDWQDLYERRIGDGKANVLVDLYQCEPHSSPSQISTTQWVQGTRTSSDGSYLLKDISPGWYFVQVTTPHGYHLSKDNPWKDDDFDSDFNIEGRSKCMELKKNADGLLVEATLDAGLIPDWITRFQNPTELVSSAVTQDEVPPYTNQEDEVAKADNNEVQPASYSATAAHAKSRTSNAPQGSQNKQQSQEVEQVTSTPHPLVRTNTLHTKSKSNLRGSPVAALQDTDTVSVVTIYPTDDATIHSNDGDIKNVGGIGELLVGPQASWHNDALLRFNLSSNGYDYRMARRSVLRLYSLASAPSGGLIYLASSPNEWDEDTVTWSTAPDNGEQVLATIGHTRPDAWVEIDVTAILLTDDGIATLRIKSEAANHSWLSKYSSKENGEGYPAPELRVYF